MHGFRRGPRPMRSLAASLAMCLAACAGCADAYYRRLDLGQAPEKYERVLPPAESRRSDAGVCHLRTDASGQTDALVLLVAEDRRVAAKLRATRIERRIGGLVMERSYRMQCEIDPPLLNAGGVGPIDAMRLVVSRLAGFESSDLERDACAIVGGGLLRILSSWPGAGQPGVDSKRTAEWIERAPPGGVGSLHLSAGGRWKFRYEVGTKP